MIRLPMPTIVYDTPIDGPDSVWDEELGQWIQLDGSRVEPEPDYVAVIGIVVGVVVLLVLAKRKG